MTDTSRHADYILPATTFLEREDVPVALMGFFSTPFMQVTEAVVPPRGEARQEWRIIDDISRRDRHRPLLAAAAAHARAARRARCRRAA